MLTITKKLSETIRIADDIFLKVLYLDNGQVKLGLTAPRSVPDIRCDMEDLREKSVEKLRRRIIKIRQRDGRRTTVAVNTPFGDGVF